MKKAQIDARYLRKYRKGNKSILSRIRCFLQCICEVVSDFFKR